MLHFISLQSISRVITSFSTALNYTFGSKTKPQSFVYLRFKVLALSLVYMASILYNMLNS